MALWLFKRKSRRKRGRASSPVDDFSAMPRSFTAPSGPVAAGPISSSPIRRRPSSRKHQRPEPNKLQRRIRTYSFESGRADNLEIGNAGTWKGAARRKPSIPSPPHANGGPLNGSASDGIGGNTAQIERNPTLHHSDSKRDGRQRMSRTKSSRRRKNADDRAREAKIKALSNPSNANDSYDFTPMRPAAETWSAGRPMKRETMKVAHPNSVAARYARKLPSDISLPMAESIDSAMSSDSDQVAFVISPFAALAPKPTLRYASQPRASAPGNGGGYVPARSISQKRKLSKPIPEATLRAHKRVDDLANDMNASDLRELMERDARRRDRRRVQDEERAARRLARQAEKHRLQQGHLQSEQPAGANSARPLAPVLRSSPELARGVLGREAVGLGPGTTSAIVTSAVRRESPTPPPPTPSERNSILLEERPERDIDDPLPQGLRGDFSTPSAADRQDGADLPAVNSGSASNSRRIPSPVDMYHRPNSIPTAPVQFEPPESTPELTAPRQEAAALPARTPSMLRRLARIRRRMSSASSIKEDSETVAKTNATVARKPSNGGLVRRGSLTWGSLGALFRWRSRSKRTPQGQSSFANLSRDSMAAQSSIQRSLHNFDAVPHSHLRNPSQTLVEESSSFAAPETAAGMAGGHFASTASVNSSAKAARPTKPHPMKVTGLVPKRTLSRFREDLPDFLKSPPASRIQSPEVQEAVSPIQAQMVTQGAVYSSSPTQNSSFVNNSGDDESIILMPTGFHEAPQQPPSFDSTSMGHNSTTNGTRDTPTSWLQMEETEPSPEPQQSLSLASIDSEGSWLSGRTASRRRVSQMQPSLDSVSRSFQKTATHQHHRERSWPSNGSTHGQQPAVSPTEAELVSSAHGTVAVSSAQHMDDDESSIVLDDEYLSRLAHSSTGGGSRAIMQRESTGDMLPSSDDELDTVNGDGVDPRWGSVNEKRVDAAFVMSHRANLIQSREVLMTSFSDGEKGMDRSESPVDSSISPVSMASPISQISSEFKEEEAGLQRATSVNLGRGHARHISAGSAKLLEITPSPRNSVDAKAGWSREPLF